MKTFVLGCAAALLTVSGTSPTLAQEQRRQNAVVELTVTDPSGKRVELGALPQADRQRIISLRNNLQQWGNQQSQRVSVTISCKFRPLSCTITIAF